MLGVEDDGTPIGVNPNAVQGIKKNFVSTLNNPQKTSPSLFLNLEEIDLDGKLLLHAYIPVSSQIQSCVGRIYDRNEDGDFDITNSSDLVAHLSIRKSSQFTEREVFPYAKEKHLLLDKLMPLVRNMAIGRVQEHPWKTMSDMDILKSAGLYEEDVKTGKRGFNRAAILLFGRDEIIQQVAPGYVTDCLLRVNNTDRYDDRQRVETNLIESFDALMGFIAKHTNDPFFLIDNLNVSVRSHIAKEIVSNILVHREYSGTFPARIIIEKDRLVAENWNRALRHGPIDPANFEPYPKNPILARFFVNIGYADTLGSGVRNLVKYTKLYSGGAPELTEGEIFRTSIPLGANVPIGSMQSSGKEHESSVTQKVAEKVTERVTEVTEKVTEDELKILAAFSQNGEITQNELAMRLGVSRKTVAARIKALKEKNLIRRVGSDTKGHWEVIVTV